jgi:uncharacterized membrane-anchored protein YitT (DUF2179 family)
MRQLRREAANALLMAAGVLAAGMGLKGFLLSSHFIDGGVTGVSMLLDKVTPVPLAVWLPIVNLPFIVLGLHQLGAAYSILTYVAAARTLDFVLHGIEEFTAITIISDGCAEIRGRILDELGRGVTIYKGRGGKTGEDREIIYCVVTRLEIGRLMRIVDAIDPNAFVVQHPLANVRGGVVRRPAIA